MLKHKISLLATVILILGFTSSASAASGMEEYFFESGKIKVVVVVASIVLCGLFVFLFMLEKRLRKLENKK